MAISDVPTKRLAISKANTQMVVVLGIASFITVFCLVASFSIWSTTRYQVKVIDASQKAKEQLSTDITSYNSLVSAYEKFDGPTTNVLGGSSTASTTGTSGSNTFNNAGDNAKIVLDALPSTYDFPALATSIENILNNGGFDIGNISGTDNQMTEQSNNSSSNPQTVAIPFEFNVVNTNYAAIGQLLNTLNDSIRPMQINTIDIEGSGDQMTLTVNAQTYYQPAKTLSITNKVVQ
jgi:hypothetical protein